MRVQTTIEFMMLLGAVASASLFVLGTYSHLAGMQRSAFGRVMSSVGNSAYQQPIAANGFVGYPHMSLEVSNVSYLGMSNGAQIVMYLPDGAKLISVTLHAQGTGGVNPFGYDNMSWTGVSVLPFAFAPSSQGLMELNASAVVSLAGKRYDINTSGYSFAEYYPGSGGPPGNGSTGSGFEASIEQLNNSVNYPLSPPSEVYSITTWNACQPYDCGQGVWQITTPWPSCNYWGSGQRAFCAEKIGTGTSTAQISSSGTFGYNTVLDLNDGHLVLSSDLTSLDPSANVMAPNGVVYGRASVMSVTGNGGYMQPYSQYVIMDRGGTLEPINESRYGIFQSQWGNLVSELSAYNRTDPGQFGSIDWWLNAISVYDGEEQSFTGSAPANVSLCKMASGQSAYTCKISSPLFYNISVKLDPGLDAGNASLFYQGSTISLR